MNLILLNPADLRDGRARLTGERARTILGRHDPAGRHAVGILNGPKGTARISRISDREVELDCVFDAAIPERPRIDLLLALPRPKVLRRLWAEIAAMGVNRIILTNADRVERNYFDTHVLTPECYRPLLIEGLEQTRDTQLPEVTIHRQFKILIEDHLDSLCPSGLRLMAQPSAERARIRDIAPTDPGDRLLLAVGPEGGWNDFETGLLEAHRFRRISMGPRALRTNTAVIALLALAGSG